MFLCNCSSVEKDKKIHSYCDALLWYFHNSTNFIYYKVLTYVHNSDIYGLFTELH